MGFTEMSSISLFHCAFYYIYTLPLTIIELYKSQPHYIWMGANCLQERVLKINDGELLGKNGGKKTYG